MSRVSVARIVLAGQPSCIQIVPNHHRYALVGTYELKQDREDAAGNTTRAQERTGSLQLLRLTETVFTVAQAVNQGSGILDLQFAPHDATTVCTADSTGTLTFRTIKVDSNGQVEIGPRAVQVSVTENDTSVLVLSLQWHPKDSAMLVCTLSDGRVMLVKINSSSMHKSLGSKAASTSPLTILDAKTEVCTHSLEAWTSAFMPSGSALLSGGDDCVLQFTPLPSSTSADTDAAVSPGGLSRWTNRKIHSAGVTAILPLDEITMVTGSYDDHVRVVEMVGGRPRVLAELNLGGGVWRLKLMRCDVADENSSSVTILASCMHAGVRVVRARKSHASGWTLEVRDSFEEHKSMNYASDFLVLDDNASAAVVSTSFYDRLACLWSTASIS